MDYKEEFTYKLEELMQSERTLTVHNESRGSEGGSVFSEEKGSFSDQNYLMNLAHQSGTPSTDSSIQSQ